MNDRNITNMITSILSAVITATFIPLLIIKFISVSKLGVILFSIGYSFLLVYFILKSIYFGINNETGKDVLFRIFRVFLDIFLCLIFCYFSLSINYNIKWIFFGIVCAFTLFNIFNSIFDSLNIVRWIIHGIIICLFLFIILSSFRFNLIVFMGCGSLILFYIGNIVGKITNNKILLSSDIVSVILFGLFLLFI